MSDRAPTPSPHSPWRAAGLGLLLLEAAGLLGIAAWYLVLLLTGDPADASGAGVTLALAVLAGVGLVLLARLLNAGRSGARTPALLAQVFVVVVGAPLVFTERWYVGVPLVALAGLTSAALLAGTGHRDA